MKIIFFKQMESSFGRDFAIIAKLAPSDSSATSRPYKKGGGGGGGGGGGSFQSHFLQSLPSREPSSARAQVPYRALP